MIPPNGIPASRRRPWKKIASSTGSRSGLVTSRNVVSGSPSSSFTPAARRRNPSMRPLSERKKTDRSSSRSMPVSLRITEKTTLVPRPTTRAASPVGARITCRAAAVEEAGEPVRRVEEVQGVARGRRVEDDDVAARIAMQLVELGDGGELLRAGHRAGQLAVDAVAQDVARGALVRRQQLDEVVERALRVELHRPQLAREVDALDAVRLVAELLEPERRREPPRGVDRHDRDALAVGREPEREGRGRRRLPDAAGAGDDDDALAGEVHVSCAGELVGQRGEVRRGDRLGVQPQRSVAGGPGETARAARAAGARVRARRAPAGHPVRPGAPRAAGRPRG